MKTSAIPSKLHPDIIALAGEGKSTREISTWLQTEHQVTASHGAVARMLRHQRIERADLTRTIVQEKLGSSVARDIDRLEQMTEQLHTMACEAHEANNIHSYLRIVEQMRKVIHTKLHFAGLDQPDVNTQEHSQEANDALTRGLARLAERMRQDQAARAGTLH